MHREKHNGRYVYFSSDVSVYKQQYYDRLEMLSDVLPSEAIAISILVEIIKSPSSGIEELSKKLKSRRMEVSEAMIQKFLNSHGLSLKKTLDFLS